MLGIIFEFPLVIYPFLSEISKIIIVEGPDMLLRFIIKNSAETTKLIVIPVSLIGNLAILVMQFTDAVHFIIFPLANIITSIIKLKFSFSIFHSIFQKAFVSSSTVKDEYNIFRFVFLVTTFDFFFNTLRFCIGWVP